MSEKKSKLLKSFALQSLEDKDVSQEDFEKIIDSDILDKNEKKKILFNLDELGTEKISESVLKEEEMNKKEVISRLLSGIPVEGVREGGNSMTPLIKHRQPFDLYPVDPTKLEKGDIVLVKVKGRIFTHKVIGLRKGQVQIGNNHGGVNGWTSLDNVYGIVVAVDGVEISKALMKVPELD